MSKARLLRCARNDILSTVIARSECSERHPARATEGKQSEVNPTEIPIEKLMNDQGR